MKKKAGRWLLVRYTLFLALRAIGKDSLPSRLWWLLQGWSVAQWLKQICIAFWNTSSLPMLLRGANSSSLMWDVTWWINSLIPITLLSNHPKILANMLIKHIYKCNRCIFSLCEFLHVFFFLIHFMIIPRPSHLCIIQFAKSLSALFRIHKAQLAPPKTSLAALLAHLNVFNLHRIASHPNDMQKSNLMHTLFIGLYVISSQLH